MTQEDNFEMELRCVKKSFVIKSSDKLECLMKREYKLIDEINIILVVYHSYRYEGEKRISDKTTYFDGPMEDRITKSQLLRNKANGPSNISSQQNTRRVSIIYTIKTRLKYICVCVYVCIYMFICSELIEETGRPPGLIFGMWGYFWPGSDKFES